NDARSLTNQANNGDYLELAVSLTGFQDPVLTYETTRNNNGFNSNQWSYSTNGGASFTNFGVPVNPSNTPINTFNAGTLVTRDFTGVGALANQASVILRYTVGGASGGGGASNDIDNIQINAPTSRSALPPGSTPEKIHSRTGSGHPPRSSRSGWPRTWET